MLVSGLTQSGRDRREDFAQVGCKQNRRFGSNNREKCEEDARVAIIVGLPCVNAVEPSIGENAVPSIVQLIIVDALFVAAQRHPAARQK